MPAFLNTDTSDSGSLPSAIGHSAPVPLNETAGRSLEQNREWQYLASCSRPEARLLVPYEHARRLQCLPLVVVKDALQQEVLVVVSADLDAPPLNKELRFISGYEVIIEQVDAELVARALPCAYFGGEEFLESRVLSAERLVPTKPAPGEPVRESADGVPKLLDAVLHRADALSASDIHLEPNSDGLRLRLRIDGRLREDTAFSVSQSVGENLLRRIKLLAKLDITCDFRPQEGGFVFPLADRELRLRVSVIPQVHGEKAVLRLLENGASRSTVCGSARSGTADCDDATRFSALGLNLEQERLLRASAGASSGVILLSGPTGSGKSTLLYAVLEHLNSEWRNIVTLEDPVERYLVGINQTDVSRSGERSYSAMLAPLLRQDPDVIMLGEIRDKDTAETVLHAATTGHLVLSTVHAGSAAEVVLRLLQLGIKPFLVAAAVRLVVAQRLVGLNCRFCARRFRASSATVRFFMLDDPHLVESAGCARCSGSGILGRRGVFEFLSVSTPLRELLSRPGREAPSLTEIRDAMRESPVLVLAEQVREILIQGEISPRTALHALGFSPEILSFGGDQTENC